MKRQLLLVMSMLMAPAAVGQQVDTLVVALPEILVGAFRTSEIESSAPFAVSRIARTDSDVALQPALSLAATLQGIPGVWLSDRGHYALGERLVVRGMGWRSAFGVRGVQVLLDGIPLTLPDGQAVLDIVDPASIRRAEVVRGPSSTFWGNGSGGVLLLSTDAATDSVAAAFRALGGSHGLRKVSATASANVGAHRVHGFVSALDASGFREHAAGRFTRGVLHGDFSLDGKTRLRLVAGGAVQDVESPGSLTRSEAEARPQQPDVRNISTNAGKKSTQAQAGVTLLRQTGAGLLSVTTYGIVRRLDNPLSFTFIELDRVVAGGRMQLENRVGSLDWGIGVDAGLQQDERINANNDQGVRGPDIALDQREGVRNVSAFAYGRFDLPGPLAATAAVRTDAIRFTLTDHFDVDGDQSGARSFSAVSPSLGIAYSFGSALLFANLSTAFETPTTTELVNQPDGSAGLNAEVGAQRTIGFEAGARGWMSRVRFDVAVFRLTVTDRLQPFQDADGRTYFQNAGTNVNRGVEIAVRAPVTSGVALEATYTGSRFRFDDAESQGLRIPGVPEHHLVVASRVQARGVRANVAAEYASKIYADDGNQSFADAYAVVNAGVGYTELLIGRVHVQPFVNIDNIFDTAYIGSVVVNAFGGRYFEPSPGRTLQFGLHVSL